MAKQIGAGDYMYEVAEGWGEWPVDGVASDVATDSQDRVYVAVRTSQTEEVKTGVTPGLRPGRELPPIVGRGPVHGLPRSLDQPQRRGVSHGLR